MGDLSVKTLRPLPALVASTLVLALKPILYPEFNNVLYDYVVWLASALALLTAAADLKLFWNKAGVYSTLAVELTGTVLVAVGRFASLVANALYFARYIVIPPMGGPYTSLGFCLSLWVFPGSFLILVASTLHVALAKPVEFVVSPPLAQVAGVVVMKLSSASRALTARTWTAPVLVFLLALSWRLVPEILWWPWPIGWDTVEYMAHLLDFAERLNPFTSYYWMGGMRNVPPLLNILLLPAALAGHSWTAFKFYPPLAYATLAASTTLYAQKALKLSWRKSLFTGAVVTFYFLNMRISWDYHRQLLGSIFMMLSITHLDSSGMHENVRRALMATALLVLAALSHEVTAFVAIALSLTYIVGAMQRREKASLVAGVTAFTASTLLELWYWGFTRLLGSSKYTGVSLPGLGPYTDVVNVTREAISYLVSGFGLTLPLATLTLARPGLVYTKAAFIALLAAGLSPIIAPYSAVVTWYRFLIGAAPLASSLAGAKLTTITKDRKAAAVYLLVVMLPSVFHVFSLGQGSMYASSLREVPSYFGPSPLEAEKLAEVTQYFLENPPQAPILAEHGGIAKWVHLAVRNPAPEKLVWDAPLIELSACRLLNSTGMLLIVTSVNVETGCGELHLLKDGSFKVYLLRAGKDADKHNE